MSTGKEDIPVMLDCLQELFNEYGDAVTPPLLIQRMERKLHRHMRMHVVAHEYASLGFFTIRNNALQKYCIIPALELLAKIRAQFGRNNANTAGDGKEPINHSIK